MERSVQKLNLAAATKPIPDYGAGNDPYQGYQVHDYLQVSFIRQDPRTSSMPSTYTPYNKHAQSSTNSQNQSPAPP
jgi:hypothetical protein